MLCYVYDDHCYIQLFVLKIKIQMDNLSIQLTPIQVSYNSRDVLQLSCIFKKVVISTGHILQKRSIKAEADMIAGKNKFSNGPIFSLNNQFELNNTKISLHFLAQKNRNISCIGKTQIDVSALPNQKETLIDLNLNDCIYEKGKIKLQVKRKQEYTQFCKNNKVKPEEMGLLQTEGQKREEFLMKRRGNQNIPNAYQISRKNYKQVEIDRHETSRSGGKERGSGSKGSYHQRFQGNSKISSSSRVKTGVSNIVKSKNKYESPKPRQRTPEPIKLKQVLKPGSGVDNNHNYTRYTIGGRGKKDFERGEEMELPSKLIVRPYQNNTEKMSSKQNSESLSEKLSYNDLEIQKKNKYLDITEKLQLIQDRIIGVQDKKYKTETRSIYQKNTELNSNFQFEINKSEKPLMHKSQKDMNIDSIQEQKIQVSMVTHRYDPNIHDSLKENILVQQNIDMKKEVKNDCINLSQQRQNEGILKRVEIKKEQMNTNKQSKQQLLKNNQKSNISDRIKTNQQNSFQSERKRFRQSIQNIQKDNKDLSKENEILRAKLLDSQGTVKKLMIELQQFVLQRGQKQKKINDLTKQLNEMTKQVSDAKVKDEENTKILAKLMKQFQQKQDQIVYLEDQIINLKKTIEKQNKVQSTNNAQLKNSQSLIKNEKQQVNKEELQQYKKKLTEVSRVLLDTQSMLRLKQNQIKHLRLQIKNSIQQKKQLQQQLRVIASSNKQQMARQKSLAHINQISNTSLAHQTRRQNQTLKNEVKILQQKLNSLNKLIQQLISKDNMLSASKLALIANTVNDTQFENRQKIKQLLQKCNFLEQELRVKKNLMAEIINIIWNQADPKLMESIQQFMGQ